MMLEALREEVCRANMALPEYGLVTWTSGNFSGRDPESGLVVIKPSGLMFPELTPENMAIVDIEGKVVEASHGPSTDTASHLYVYQRRPDVMGIVHTHSNYATAFAAAAGVDLGLDRPGAFAEALGPVAGRIAVVDHVPFRDRDPEVTQDRLGLVLVNFHFSALLTTVKR